jgi:uncharacterized protein involved in response to NO
MTTSGTMVDIGEKRAALVRERKKSWMLRAWILSGLFFMALPGTLLGFSNLVSISAHHGLGSMPAAWMEGHGHAQLFGWIGRFILGIGFYSQPTRGRAAERIPLACFGFWTSGVLLRWIANIYEWHWRSLLVISSALEVVAVLLFLMAASHHKRPEAEPARARRKGMEAWMIAVLLSTAALTAGVIFNLVECVRLAMYGAAPSFPHVLDQKYLLLLGWGFLAPVVWGFSARWLPAFLALNAPRARVLRAALLVDFAGIGFGLGGRLVIATILLVLAAVGMVFALRMLEKPHGRAKVQGIHASFPVFVRMAYIWLVIAAGMSVWAAMVDQHGGIWGASRHALTVGFAATMVFSIGPRILPHFCGITRLFSSHLMFASLLLLQTGCMLRVSSEPLAYEGLWGFGWHVLPVSGMLELVGVLVFAANMAATIAFGRSMFERVRPECTSLRDAEAE